MKTIDYEELGEYIQSGYGWYGISHKEVVLFREKPFWNYELGWQWKDTPNPIPFNIINKPASSANSLREVRQYKGVSKDTPWGTPVEVRDHNHYWVPAIFAGIKDDVFIALPRNSENICYYSETGIRMQKF
jgi:hypothetical protein